jgi:hypothetical protein
MKTRMELTTIKDMFLELINSMSYAPSTTFWEEKESPKSLPESKLTNAFKIPVNWTNITLSTIWKRFLLFCYFFVYLHLCESPSFFWFVKYVIIHSIRKTKRKLMSSIYTFNSEFVSIHGSNFTQTHLRLECQSMNLHQLISLKLGNVCFKLFV